MKPGTKSTARHWGLLVRGEVIHLRRARDVSAAYLAACRYRDAEVVYRLDPADPWRTWTTERPIATQLEIDWTTT